MATVQSLSGKFFAKDPSGNIIELQVGQEIDQGMTVFGETAASTINITMDNNNVISLSGIEEQLFDGSLDSEQGLEEVAVAEDNIMDLVNASNDTKVDETEAGVETAAGEETPNNQTADTASFNNRDGGETNVRADLRNAEFTNREQVVEDDGEIQDNEAASAVVTEAPTVDQHTLSNEKIATYDIPGTPETGTYDIPGTPETGTYDVTSTLFTAYASEGNPTVDNPTAWNAAVSYDAIEGLGVNNQNLEENGNQTSYFEENESLLINFGKEISSLDFTINAAQYTKTGADYDKLNNKDSNHQ